MKTSERILQYFTTHGSATGNSLVDYLGITDRAVRKQLKTLLESGQIIKIGSAPKVYYTVNNSTVDRRNSIATYDKAAISDTLKNHVNKEFLYITPRGTVQEGWAGFEYWCQERKMDIAKTAERYEAVSNKYGKFKKNSLIDGMPKLRSTFDDIGLDELLYLDFYSVDIFGKTRLGQLLLFAKQSQNRKLINQIADDIKSSVEQVIREYQIDGIGFIPPTVKRELQFIKQIEARLNLSIKALSITKIKTPVIVPQKTLNKLDDRIINAYETMHVDNIGVYNNILLIDDAVGSGATLNEVAKKIRQKGICHGKIIGLTITGSFNGFEVISEV